MYQITSNRLPQIFHFIYVHMQGQRWDFPHEKLISLDERENLKRFFNVEREEKKLHKN